MADNKIVIQINAKDDATRVILNTQNAVSGLTRQIASMAAAVGVTFGVADLAKHTLDVASNFEKLSVSMKTVTGSSQAAQNAMAWITDFSAKTPYRLNEVANAFTKLSSRGLDAKSLIEPLGDAASAMGKSLDQAVDMMADAVVGENERLKEFGISAADLGNRVMYTWNENGQEMVKVTNKNAKDIQNALLGAISRFKGGMQEQSQTWGGMLSTMSDDWDIFLNRVANTGAFQRIKASVKGALSEWDRLDQNGTVGRWADQLGTSLDNLIKSFVGSDSSIEKTGQRLVDLGTGALDTAGKLGKTLIPAVKGVGGALGDLLEAFNKLPDPLKGAIGGGAAMGLATKFVTGSPMAGAGVGLMYGASSELREGYSHTDSIAPSQRNWASRMLNIFDSRTLEEQDQAWREANAKKWAGMANWKASTQAATPFHDLITAAAQSNQIPVELFDRLIKVESSYNPYQTSPKGAMGLGQLMPGTARDLGVENPYDPTQNLAGSAKYLKQQYDTFHDWTLAVAAYNAGPKAVAKAGGVPNFEETQDYVTKIMTPDVVKAMAGGGVSGKNIAQRIKETIGNPEALLTKQEEFQRNMDNLKALFDKGLLSQDDYSKYSARFSEKYKGSYDIDVAKSDLSMTQEISKKKISLLDDEFNKTQAAYDQNKLTAFQYYQAVKDHAVATGQEKLSQLQAELDAENRMYAAQKDLPSKSPLEKDVLSKEHASKIEEIKGKMIEAQNAIEQANRDYSTEMVKSSRAALETQVSAYEQILERAGISGDERFKIEQDLWEAKKKLIGYEKAEVQAKAGDAVAAALYEKNQVLKYEEEKYRATISARANTASLQKEYVNNLPSATPAQKAQASINEIEAQKDQSLASLNPKSETYGEDYWLTNEIAKMKEWQVVIEDTGSVWQGFMAGMKEAQQEQTDFLSGKDLYRSFSQSFKTAFKDIISGTKSVSGAFSDMASNILDTITDKLMDKSLSYLIDALFGSSSGESSGSSWGSSLGMAGGIMSAIAAVFGGGGATGSEISIGGTFGSASSSYSTMGTYYHEGGTVGMGGGRGKTFDASLFAFAPRFHAGLASDEFPAILQTGEEVRSRSQVAADRRSSGNSGKPVIVNQSFNFQNANVPQFRRSQSQIAAETRTATNRAQRLGS